MDINVIYIGLDVDDTQYHGSGLNKDTVEFITFQCRSTFAYPGAKAAYKSDALSRGVRRNVIQPDSNFRVRVTPANEGQGAHAAPAHWGKLVVQDSRLSLGP